MRKFLISVLLASAAVTPALADPPSKADREQAREERQKAREDRQQARKERPERPQIQKVDRVQPKLQVQPQMQVRQQPVDRTVRTQTLQRNNNVQTARQRINAQQQAAQDRREQRADERAQFRQQRTVSPVIPKRTPVVSNVPRPGTQPPVRVDNRRNHAPRWSTNWRHNNKYDWYNWRKKNRSRFHLGFYYDPFGWGYQPYQIGWRLWPSYYSNRYWINDPWQYRLPYAPPGYQWVRYWNDAVLVDTWTGEVVDVLYNFFW